MYIEIDQQSYYIHLQDDISEITLLYKSDNTIHLRVPARCREEQLISYIKTHKWHLNHQFIANNDQPSNKITLFEKTYDIVPKNDVYKAYIKGAALYVPLTYHHSTTSLSRMRIEILENEINKAFTYWEEELHVILPIFKLRKLKTNSHYICRNKDSITIAKHLIDRPKDFFCYIIAKIVFNYFNIKLTIQEELFECHVKNWKHIRKVIAYEQHTNN